MGLISIAIFILINWPARFSYEDLEVLTIEFFSRADTIMVLTFNVLTCTFISYSIYFYVYKKNYPNLYDLMAAENYSKILPNLNLFNYSG